MMTKPGVRQLTGAGFMVKVPQKNQNCVQFQKSVFSPRPIEEALKAGSLPAARWSV